MKTKFQINNYLPEIYVVVIESETPTKYVIDGKKYKKENIFDTYQEARAELLERCEKQLNFYQHCLQSEVNKLKKIIDL